VFSDPLSSSKRRLSASSPNGFEVDFRSSGCAGVTTGRSSSRGVDLPYRVAAECIAVLLERSLYAVVPSNPRHSTLGCSTSALVRGISSRTLSPGLRSSYRVCPERPRQPLRAAAAFLRFCAPTACSNTSGMTGIPANISRLQRFDVLDGGALVI